MFSQMAAQFLGQLFHSAAVSLKTRFGDLKKPIHGKPKDRKITRIPRGKKGLSEAGKKNGSQHIESV